MRSRSSAAPARSATAWRCAGRAPATPVVIGSRSEERAAEAARKLSEQLPDAEIEGLPNEVAAKQGPVVFLTVPFRAQSENLNNLREALAPGQLLVDCTVPLAAAVGGKATRSLGVWQGSAAQQAQDMVPEGVDVVSALHTVSAPRLADPGEDLDEDVLLCGDSKADKAKVARDRRGDPGPAGGQRGPARDGPDRRAADADADLDQRPLQGARGNQDRRPARGGTLGMRPR